MKQKISKNNRTKKTAHAFSKKSKARAKHRAQNITRHTKTNKNEKKNNIRKQPAKAPIEPELGMQLDGVLYRVREGRRREVWRVIATSRRVGFDLLPVGEIRAEEGELVSVCLTRLPDRDGVAQCRITHVFGAADSKRANYEAILASNGIECDFPSAVVEEAERVSRQPLSAQGRLELRDRLILTIDGADAKDLDDAVSLVRTADGWELGVHIADVSHYVRAKGEVDREAMRRGTSVYFTDKVVPMLPVSLSNGACSLGAGEDKYALSAIITLDREGRLVSAEVKKSIIRSSVRGVYSEVNDLFERGEHSEFYDKYAHVFGMLTDMHELYRLRERIAAERGYVELESAESVILLDSEGEPCEIVRRERGDAERLIEQFMLLANEAVALYMSSRGMPCVYRIHESPDEEKIRSFMNLCSNYRLDAGLLASGGASAKSYAKILDNAREKGIADIVSESMLRSFMKAKYSEIRSPHFGLALEYYAHFTSPIRRYPDLAVHRLLSEAIAHGEQETKKYASFAREAAQRSSENELRALNAERAIEDLYKTLYMKKHEGEEFDARIVSVQSFGFFCMLENTCEGLVPVSSLSGYYTYSEQLGTLSSRGGVFAPGDTVRVRVRFADVVKHKVELEYLGTLDTRGRDLLSTGEEGGL